MIQSGKGARGRDRHHLALRHGHDPEGHHALPGTKAYQRRLAADDRGRRGRERAGPLHRLHRLRMDVEHGRQQPAPQRDLPRRRRQGQPGRALHDDDRRSAATTRADLWKWMAAYEEKTGGSVLAIAHNGNLSNGRMFPVIEAFGKHVDRSTRRRAPSGSGSTRRRRPRATGEAHPFLSPNDEFADFEIWDKGNLDGSVAEEEGHAASSSTRAPRSRTACCSSSKLGSEPVQVRPGRKQRRPHGPRRDGGRQLLRQDDPAGAEPRAPDADLRRQPEDRRQDHGLGGRRLRLCRGLGHENTRESIWDAMERRETYATTGLAHDRALLRRLGLRGERRARPHAGAASATRRACRWAATCRGAPAGKAPTFLVAALKDPIGANLDRIQIVKGWLDAKGELHEKVFDVAWSDGRKPDPKTGKLPVGRQHRGRRERDLDQHDRRSRAHRRVEGPGLRPGAAGLLLRARDRDPDAALDRIRRRSASATRRCPRRG